MPHGHGPAARLRPLLRGVGRGHGGLPLGHRRWSSRSRSTRRSSTSSGAVRRLGPPAHIGETIRARVHDEQGITCSVGVAPTKFVAKLASTRAKPDGLLVVPRRRRRRLPAPAAGRRAVGSGGEDRGGRWPGWACAPSATWPAPRGAPWSAPSARPRAPTSPRWPGAATSGSSCPHEPDKSIGAEETFGTDVDDPEVVLRELLRLSTKVAGRLRAAGYAGRTVSLKVRFADFTTITRSRTLREPTDVGQEIYATARALYEALGLHRARLRLVGVRVEGLVDAETRAQQLLLDAPEHGCREAELAVDAAARRFGPGAIRPGSLLDQPSSRSADGVTIAPSKRLRTAFAPADACLCW